MTVLDEADHMADLGFLPAVRRILEQTPRGGQRMLFSATLDSGVNVLVKRFLDNPATHEADSAQSPISTMDHHVLHVHRDHRVAVLVDLASAPGRTVVFTRTKHGAKNLARQLNSRGVPTVELHGNLAQNARTRNMEAFHSGAPPRWSPPTSPRAASTSTTWPWSCTPTRRPSTRPTCTARAARRAPVLPARSSR